MKHFPSLPRVGHRASGAAVLALALLGTNANAIRAQGVTDDGFRIGVAVAGTGFLSLIVEYRWGNTAVEAALSTISFKDAGLYGGVRQYLGSASPQPVMGLGLWGLVAGSEHRTGGALILRAPIGVDWNVTGDHSLGFNLALNKALVVRRSDPTDTEPPNPRLVPLPALEYRVRTN